MARRPAVPFWFGLVTVCCHACGGSRGPVCPPGPPRIGIERGRFLDVGQPAEVLLRISDPDPRCPGGPALEPANYVRVLDPANTLLDASLEGRLLRFVPTSKGQYHLDLRVDSISYQTDLVVQSRAPLRLVGVISRPSQVVRDPRGGYLYAMLEVATSSGADLMKVGTNETVLRGVTGVWEGADGGTWLALSGGQAGETRITHLIARGAALEQTLHADLPLRSIYGLVGVPGGGLAVGDEALVHVRLEEDGGVSSLTRHLPRPMSLNGSTPYLVSERLFLWTAGELSAPPVFAMSFEDGGFLELPALSDQQVLGSTGRHMFTLSSPPERLRVLRATETGLQTFAESSALDYPSLSWSRGGLPILVTQGEGPGCLVPALRDGRVFLDLVPSAQETCVRATETLLQTTEIPFVPSSDAGTKLWERIDG